MQISKSFIGVLCLSIGCNIAPAQVASTTGAPPATQDTTQIWAGNLGSDPVGLGDLLYVSVAGSPELTRSYRVSSEGKIALPLLHEGIPVLGLRPSQVADAVAARLVERHLLVAPIVSAEVLEYRSRLVSVVGAVKMPATIQALGEMKLLDAIARAQGLSPEAGPEIVVTRPGNGPEGRETLHIGARVLLSGNDPSLNIVLHGGEEIRVPEALKLYVVGNVRIPGAYPLTDLEGSTVLKALALSQGTQPFTAKTAFVYRIDPASPQRREIAIQLDQILHRKAPDFALQPNDILYIPDNSKRRISASVFDHIAGMGGSAATSLAVRY